MHKKLMPLNATGRAITVLLSLILLQGQVAVAQSGTRRALPPSGALKHGAVPFIDNVGQTDPRVMFYASTSRGTVFVTEDGLTYSLLALPSDPSGSHADGARVGLAINERFVGSHLRPVGAGTSVSMANYYVGKQENWRQNVPMYDSVTLEEAWASIDVKIRAFGNGVEKTFRVKPGGHVDDIRIEVEGIEGLSVVIHGGALKLKTEAGSVFFTKPVAYQDIDGTRVSVDVSYIVEGTSYRFSVGEHDPTHTLVIDPLLASTFVGGGGDEHGYDIAIDKDGYVFVTGYARSPAYPTTTGTYDPLYNGGNADVFVTKLDPDLTSVLASTFIGGSSTAGPLLSDWGRAISIDSNGDVLVTGHTSSPDFPTTPGAYDRTYNGGDRDVFLSKLNNSLTTLLASTFIGGDSGDAGLDVTLDTSGNVFVTGYTASSDFPTTASAYDGSYNGGSADAFVAKLDNSLTTLLAATFIGGSSSGGPPGGSEAGSSMALDANGDVFLTGWTFSPDFPTTPGAYNGSISVSSDAFVSKLDNSLTSLTASTFLGGYLSSGIALDSDGEVFVTGRTFGLDLPTTPGAYDESYNGNSFDGFVSKLNNSLTSLVASTFIGGGASDGGEGIAIDSQGNIFISGWTGYSDNFGGPSDFPTTSGAYDESHNGAADVIVSKFDNSLTSLMASTFIGGSRVDNSQGIALDAAGNVFVVGFSDSYDYPTSTNAYDDSFNGFFDVIVSKLNNDLSSMAAPFECIHFEDLVLGTVYNVGDVFTTSGTTVTVESFFHGGGETTTGHARVRNSGLAGGSGKEMAVDNANLDFNIGAPIPVLSLLFGEYGGNLNIEVNGDFRNFDDFSELDGQTIGGVSVSVVNGLGNDKGSLTLEGTISSFRIGGQELWIDAVCPSAAHDMRRGASIHLGLAQPYGTLDTITDVGTTLNLDLVFPISPVLEWDLRLGYSLFYGTGALADVDIWNLSVNLKKKLTLNDPWIFINGGPGFYFINGSTWESGYNLGLGLGHQINPDLTGELTYNFHSTVTGPTDFRFGKLQLGLIWKF